MLIIIRLLVPSLREVYYLRLYFTISLISWAKPHGPAQNSYPTNQEPHERDGETRWIETGSRIVTNHSSLEQVAGLATGFVGLAVASQSKASDNGIDNSIEAIYIRWCALRYEAHSQFFSAHTPRVEMRNLRGKHDLLLR